MDKYALAASLLPAPCGKSAFARLVGARVRRCREQLGLPVRRCAAAAGWSQTNWWGIERGLRNHQARHLVTVAAALLEAAR
jgi:transcriptional regulator with XRE-family HTH domain